MGEINGFLVHTVAASLGSEEIKVAAKKEIANHVHSIIRNTVFCQQFFTIRFYNELLRGKASCPRAFFM